MAVLNFSGVSAANAAISTTYAAVVGHRTRLWRVDAFTSAGTSGVTITIGSYVVFRTPTAHVATTLTTLSWTRSLETEPNTAMLISLAAAGVGNTGTLNVQADRVPL